MQPVRSIESLNLRRIMSARGLSIDQVIEATGLDQRTISGILSGAKKPHPKTLHRLAAGLGVDSDELFLPMPLDAREAFDRATNPVLAELARDRPELFQGWTHADYAELVSRFGHGGALSREGMEQAAEATNRRRQLLRRAALVLETDQGPLLAEIIDSFWRKVRVG